MSAYGNSLIIEFGMLIDTDYGMIRLLNDKYNDTNVFFHGVLGIDDHMLKGLLQTREWVNPLQIVLINEDIQIANSLYEDIITNHYDDVLERSVQTDLVSYIKKCIDSEGNVSASILCASEQERSIIQKTFSDCVSSAYNLIVEPNRSELRLKLYDSIYLKYIKDVFKLRLKDVEGKNIFISDHRCNMDQAEYENKRLIPDKALAAALSVNNELYTIGMYAYDETYYPSEWTEDDNKFI